MYWVLSYETYWQEIISFSIQYSIWFTPRAMFLISRKNTKFDITAQNLEYHFYSVLKNVRFLDEIFELLDFWLVFKVL